MWPALRDGIARFGLGAVLPVAVFYAVFRAYGPTAGIAAGVSVSTAMLLVQLRKLRRLDPIVIIPMAIIVVQGATALLLDSVELYLLIPAVENCVWGTLLLASALLRRPMVSAVVRELRLLPRGARHGTALDTPFTVLTIVWGVAAFVKAAIRLTLLGQLSIEMFLVTATLFNTVINGSLVAFSCWLCMRAVRRSGG
ncbi:MAG: VC0807 family protein [Chloroflexota bacterium]